MRRCQSVLRIAVAFASFAVEVSGVCGDEPTKRLPVPSGPTAVEARRLVGEVYRERLKEAKNTEQNVSLSKTLLEDGIATRDNSAARYELISMAAMLAARAGAFEISSQAIERLNAEFTIDPLKVKLDALSAASKSRAARTGAAKELAKLLEEAILLDRYEIAFDVVDKASVAAKAAEDVALIKQLTRRKEQLEELAAEYEKVESALVRLETFPLDAEANLVVGRYRCLMKSDWESGNTYLALGSDEVLSELAKKELAEKPDALSLADDWYDLVDEEESAVCRQCMQDRAVKWYKTALPTLEGLNKARVLNLLQKATAIDPSVRATAKPKPDLSSVSLTGIWRSIVTGSVYALREHGGSIHVTLVSSGHMESFHGTLARNGDDLTSSGWHTVFKQDPTKTSREGTFRGKLTNPNRISGKILKVNLDKNGKLLGTAEGRTVWVRKSP